MYSHRSEPSHNRQYSDRSSRQRDGYDDHRERREPHRDIEWDSHHKYGGGTERTSRNIEYSDSPKRLYSNDSLNRERSRKSPVRRRMSSPDWGASEKKRRRFTEGDEDDYRYRRVPEDKASRQTPDSLQAHISKDFKHTLPQEEDFKCRKTTEDSRNRYRHEEVTYRHRHDDVTCRQSSGYYKDRDGHERSWDCSPERTRSQDHATQSYVKTREKNDSPLADHEGHHYYFETDVTHQRAAVPEQKKPTKGFQRFLDVLNKGVNVAMLTKIVTETPAKVDNRPHSPTSSMNTADHPWSPSCAGRQQGSCQNTNHWSESRGSQRLASPQPRHRSFSPKGCSLSDEKSLQRGDGEQSYSSSNGQSGSPSGVDKITLTPEDDHKHKQMQDVLQAIGMNLGFEELGQMSNRIQERLYGKKDNDGGRHQRGSRERDTRRAPSPRPQNGSSSSSSSFSPSPQEYYMKKDSYSAQGDVTEEQHQVQVHQAIEYGQNSSSSILQESEHCETNSKGNTAASQSFSQNPTYTLSEPSPATVMQMYSPVNRSPLPYPALLPNVPQARHGLFLPCMPPFFPYPRVPPLNIFPAVLAQTRHLLPQPIDNPQPFVNLPIQPVNTTQKSKTLSRPRCLQVIETKQPG